MERSETHQTNTRRAQTALPRQPTLLRVPVTFQVRDELLAQMAPCLLVGVNGHVAAERVNGFGLYAQGAAVAGGAYHAGADGGRDYALDRGLDAFA
ncbi:hypothetical protein B4Q13_23165, partial [Lacticaseibacillus rhamnosus]